MNVNLTPRLESLIREKVESGRYNNASEVVREALRLLEERDRLQRLRAALAEGEKGEGIPFTPELVAQMKRDAAQMALEGKQPKDDVMDAGYRAMAADTEREREAKEWAEGLIGETLA